MMSSLRLRLWNWYARHVLHYETCERCGDTRGGAVGNGQWVDGELLCDYCRADTMRSAK